MKIYCFNLRATGILWLEIEANSEEEARSQIDMLADPFDIEAEFIDSADSAELIEIRDKNGKLVDD